MPASSPLSSNQPMPVTIQRTSWAEHEAALRSIREAVFIHEQHVPEALEWDDQDAEAVLRCWNDSAIRTSVLPC